MSQIFISHAVPDRPLASALRQALTARGFRVWSGPRSRPDGELDPGVRTAIQAADHILVLLTPHTAQDRRVREEIRLATEHSGDSLWTRLRGWMQGMLGRAEHPGGARIIPLLYPGVMLSELRNWFDGVPVGLPVRVESGDLEPVLPMLLTSLGEPMAPPTPGRDRDLADELTLRLINPARSPDGTLSAIGTLLYQPANGATLVESHAFPFQAPPSPLPETLEWYLQRYPLWPVGRRRQRAHAQETAMGEWGQALYRSMLAMEADRDRFNPWLAGQHGPRRFTVEVDSELPLGSEAAIQQQAEQAATGLLGLPWELLHDGQQYLLQANPTVPIRRRLPVAGQTSQGEPPVQVLYLAPRPADRAMTGYRDTVLALLDSDITLTRLEPATEPGLQRLLDEAAQVFRVLHIDGELLLDGTDEPRLVLESTGATTQSSQLPITALLGRIQPALVVLQLYGDPRAGHRATSQLLAAGVGAVLILAGAGPETARCFLPPFYRLLAQGTRLGEAVLAGRRALREDGARAPLLDGAAWPQDWFIPVLYQNQRELRLISAPSSAPTNPLPPPPEQGLIGRHREFLTLERLLRTQPLVVVSGLGGIGKSTLVAAMADWLVRTAGFRSARVDVREINAPGELLAAIATQLALGSIPASPEALGVLLAARATVVILDHVDLWPGDPVAPPGELLDLCRTILGTTPTARFLLTARTAPGGTPASLHLGAPALDEAVTLLARAMVRRDLGPAGNDPGDHLPAVEGLVAAATGHPRVLNLIAADVAREGIAAVTETLLARRRQLTEQHPDGDQVLSLAVALEHLPAQWREQVKVLAVFERLLHRDVLANMLNLPETAAADLETALVEVGLAQRGAELLYLDPALPGFLREQLAETELNTLHERWLDGMKRLAGRLLDAGSQLGDTVARASLPELLPLLTHLEARGDAAVGDIARGLHNRFGERLPASWRERLGRPRDDDDTATEEIVEPETPIEPEPEQPPSDWGHNHFESLRRQVEQLLGQGDLASAQDNARHLLTRSLTAGENRYPEAAVDVVAAYLTYGRALRSRGAAQQALEPLQAARRRLLERHSGSRLRPALEAELGECHLQLGDGDSAVAHYRTLIQEADPEGTLPGRLRLGAILLSLDRRDEALETLQEALQQTEPEHPAMADIQQLLGVVHRQLGDYDSAEQLIQSALAQRIRRQDRSGEAAVLAEMANLFDAMGRLEEAVRLARQAASIALDLGDGLLEGQARHNLGETLLKLNRLPEARLALEQALTHKLEQGSNGEIWKTWHLLARLDTLQGKPGAADARQRAVESFLEHRRGGGRNPHPAAQLCQAVLALIQAGDTDPAHLRPPADRVPDPTQGVGLLLDKLRAVLAGERDPALAEDSRLHYQYAAELRLLLDTLNRTGPPTESG